MICKHILLITFLNKPKLILLQTVKWFQVLICISNNSFKHKSFVYTQLDDLTVLFQTIQFSISHFFTFMFKCQTLLFDSLTGPYRVPPFWVSVDMGTLALKGPSTFPKVPSLLKPHHQIV